MEKIIKYREDPEMLDDGSMWMTRHMDDEVFDVANIKLEQLALENFLSKGSEVEVMEGGANRHDRPSRQRINEGNDYNS